MSGGKFNKEVGFFREKPKKKKKGEVPLKDSLEVQIKSSSKRKLAGTQAINSFPSVKRSQGFHPKWDELQPDSQNDGQNHRRTGHT